VSTFILGPAGCGKTAELVRRACAAAVETPVLVTSPAPASLGVLRGRIDHPNVKVRELRDLAFDILAGAELIDDVRAAKLFEEAAQPLLSLSWTEFIEAELDPEVPGLRAPERFLDAAFRLFCKLRDARISPEQFLESALRGAAQFYAKPPNLAHPDLLYYTKDSHRDSLDADAAELQRQYRREIDLAKILAKLYRTYLDHPVRVGCLTSRDAVAEAARRTEQEPALGAALRSQYPRIFIDDAQEFVARLQIPILDQERAGVALDRRQRRSEFVGDGGDEAGGQHAVNDAPSEARIARILLIKMHRVRVAGDLRVARYVLVANRPGELGPVPSPPFRHSTRSFSSA